MGEILPNGQIQGYSCAYCGQPCNIQGTGHGKGICIPIPAPQDKAQEDWADRIAAELLPCPHGCSDEVHETLACAFHCRSAVAAALRERDEFAERRAYERGRKDMLNEARGAIGALSVAGEEKVTWTKTR
jgi:hypothetical protein